MKERNQEAIELSEEILKNIELDEIASQQVLLKCLRLARLVNDVEAMDWLSQEAYGFESAPNGLLTPRAWAAAKLSARCIFNYDEKQKKYVESAYTESVATMEALIKVSEQRMKVAYDSDGSARNSLERNNIVTTIRNYSSMIEKVKAKLYGYVMKVNYNLKFGKISENIFAKKRSFVDKTLADISPEAIQKFISVFENLQSGNEEDWANAVHSCRRILKDISDKLYPPSDEPIIKDGKTIKVGIDNYVNRLILYIESKSSSDTFQSIVGSSLSYIGDRLDSICGAANKGTHHKVTLEEAERYIIYTYLIMADVLSLERL